MTTVSKVLIGKLMQLGSCGTVSGINKTPITGKIYLGSKGLTGDAQGDLKYHGGVEKALHHYPAEHYCEWLHRLVDPSVNIAPGAFGENISTEGMSEDHVAIGDTFRLGGALIQVSQGRQPCWKLNVRFGIEDMAARVQQLGLTGWYYRVLESGYIEEGAEVGLVDRTNPQWTIRRLWRAFYVDTLNASELSEIVTLQALPDSWKKYARNRLETGKVEDWERRLKGNVQ